MSTVVASVSAAVALGIGAPMLSASSANALPAWLHRGPTTVYPSAGGTWQYGHWNAYVRSYYWVGKNHGSSLTLNGESIRSICVAANTQASAEKFALQTPGATDSYYYRLC